MANLSNFDLNLLRVLDALLRERSTVRAGRMLGLSQPAVSAALGRLRHALGDPLFVRQGQQLVATSFAEGLETPLRSVLQGLESVLNAAGGFDPARAQLDFRISGIDFFATMLVPALAARLQADAPGVRLQLVDPVPDNYIETLERHSIDLALLPQRSFPAWIAQQHLFRSVFAVVARRGHPALARAAIAPGAVIPMGLFCELGHVLCSPDGRFHGLGDAALARAGQSRRVVITVPVFEGVLQVVAATDLIALLPRSLASQRAATMDIALYAPPVEVEPPSLCMIWHRRHNGDAAHAWLRGLVHDILAPLDIAGAAPAAPGA